MEESVMKKYAFILAAICACLVLSCTKENPKFEEENASPAMKTVTITASIDDVLTKTSYADGTTFSWTKGDQISVYCSDGNFYPFTADETGATSTFTGSIPEGKSLGSRAFFPADDNHDLANYIYHIPEAKDITSHPSAEIPMIGNKGEDDAYTFTHCCGATKLTITNIPAKFKSVQISIASPSLKLSGNFSVFTDAGYWRWNPKEASSDSEKNFSRKVVVTNNEASIYIPYASGSDWWGKNVVNVTGFDASNNPTALVTNKEMSKSIGTVARAHVLPLKPLAMCQLGFIDWTEISSYGSSNERIVQWQATSDDNYIYFRYKITASKIKWDDAAISYDKSYIYTGFDIDRNASTGVSASGGITLSGCEARSLVYPFTGNTQGTIEFKTGDDPRSYVQLPVDNSTGAKVTTMGALDGNFAIVETAILRSTLGLTTSGITIDIQHGMDYYPTETGTITLK